MSDDEAGEEPEPLVIRVRLELDEDEEPVDEPTDLGSS